MLIILSPAKTLDYESPLKVKEHTKPEFLSDSDKLVKKLKKMSVASIGELMHISPKLAELNHDRYQNWSLPLSEKNARQSILAFQGDVYTGLEADTFKKGDFTFAQKHLRILSGLYGLLKPFDLMYPYRLEMGTKWAMSANQKNLYDFWGSKITDSLNASLKEIKNPFLVNLASNEYYKSVQAKNIEADIFTPVFKDFKNGDYKIIAFFAKKARGYMSQFLIKNRIKNPEDMKAFDMHGYGYNEELSVGNQFVFVRDEG